MAQAKPVRQELIDSVGQTQVASAMKVAASESASVDRAVAAVATTENTQAQELPMAKPDRAPGKATLSSTFVSAGIEFFRPAWMTLKEVTPDERLASLRNAVTLIVRDAVAERKKLG